MERGTDIFGEAYGIMLQNDLHADGSVDRRLMQEMILIDESSADYLYGCVPEAKNTKSHELYEFAQSFLGRPQKETVKNIVKYCSDIAKNYSVPFENMSFGGTEKEILERGTDWCADMARVGAVLLMCCGIPSRLVYLVNPNRAYSGHVAAEAFYEGKYGVCDFIYGYCFYGEVPTDTYELLRGKSYFEGYPEDYAKLYGAAAVCEYDPLADNCYEISQPNEYYLKLMSSASDGGWVMGEDRL